MENDPETMARVGLVTRLCNVRDEEKVAQLRTTTTAEERELLAEIADVRGLPHMAHLIRSV